jgi:predicted metalloprotease with PDZ domain
MVSYVYPGSPAAEGGLEPGMLLLRLHVEDQPQPLEVRVENLDRGTLPWEDLDQVSELYYERLQPPWPPAENAFTRALTGLGFGTPYEAEIVDGEQVIRRAFTVRRRPPHYAAAARHKSEALGLTVRNLTVEVRRYFQLAPEAPGVIVSRIEPGGKASVAGLKPFEIVLQVNGTPVPDVEAFAAAVGDATELRLQVKRMARTRIVKIRHRGLPAAPEPAP